MKRFDLRDAHVYGGALLFGLGVGLTAGLWAGVATVGATIYILGLRLV